MSHNSCVSHHPFLLEARELGTGAGRQGRGALCSHSRELGGKSCSQANPAAEREASSRRGCERRAPWGLLMAFQQPGNVCRACLGVVCCRERSSSRKEMSTGQEIRKGYCCPRKSHSCLGNPMECDGLPSVGLQSRTRPSS